MNKLLAPCAAAFLIVALSGSGAAAGITYDCDTAANHYSELVLPAPAGPFTVSGNVQLLAIPEVTKYAPLARVQVSSASEPGQSPSSFAGVTVMALPADARKTPSGAPAIQMVSFTRDGKEEETIPLSLLARPGGVQPFSLAFDGRNVSASIASERRTLRVKAAAPVVRIVCSTGEFLFTDLIIQPAK